MKNIARHLFIVFGLMVLFLCVSADIQRAEARPLSNPEIRRAIQQGAIVPYRVAERRALDFTKGGEVLRAKLLQKGGRLVYRLRVVHPKGRVIIVFIDARSGQVISGR